MLPGITHEKSAFYWGNTVRFIVLNAFVRYNKSKPVSEGLFVTISVVMPVFNVEPFLARAVDSVRAQTFQDFELILVDDGSTDDSGSICDTFAASDSRISAIHQENLGLSAARNAGIDASNGNYLCFIDSDDYIFPGMLMTLLAAMENRQIEAARCGRIDIEHALFPSLFTSAEQQSSFLREAGWKKTEFSPGIRTGMALLSDFLLINQPYSVCSTLFRREIFESVRFPEGRYCEDAFFWLAFCQQDFSLMNIDLLGYVAVKRDGSITTSPNPTRFIDWAHIHTKMFGYADAHNDDACRTKCFERVIGAAQKRGILKNASTEYLKDIASIGQFIKSNKKYLEKTEIYQNCNLLGRLDCRMVLCRLALQFRKRQ